MTSRLRSSPLPLPDVDPSSEVDNGSFEGPAVGADWGQYSTGGYEVTSAKARSVAQAISVTECGARHKVYVDAPAGSTETISGYSKAVGTSAGLWNNFSIYSDVKYTDGTYLWGQCARFAGGTTHWEHSVYSFEVLPGKTVEYLSLYAMYKNDPTARSTACFDDVKVLVDLPAVTNGGFEGDYVKADWSNYQDSYTVTTAEAHLGL